MAEGKGVIATYREMESAAENPKVVFQPVMCQHCNHAPCETVCPVLATTHSSEGVNQMIYNRCIGTRYCANNCPYKVRHFNWMDWNGADCFEDNLYEDYRRDDINDDLTRMVLNPDVTVRSRGVMEKCTFCVQRLQDAKLTAKKEGRPMRDGEARTACQQACPSKGDRDQAPIFRVDEEKGRGEGQPHDHGGRDVQVKTANKLHIDVVSLLGRNCRQIRALPGRGPGRQPHSAHSTR